MTHIITVSLDLIRKMRSRLTSSTLQHFSSLLRQCISNILIHLMGSTLRKLGFIVIISLMNTKMLAGDYRSHHPRTTSTTH